MDFTSSLDRKMEEVERPPVRPVGHYICSVKQHPDIDDIVSKKDGREFTKVEFIMEIVSAGEDVDPDELAEYGNPKGGQLRKAFIFSKDADDAAGQARSEYNLKRFLNEHLGLDEDLTFREAFAAATGTQCLVELKHRPDPENPEVLYEEAGKTAPV